MHGINLWLTSVNVESILRLFNVCWSNYIWAKLRRLHFVFCPHMYWLLWCYSSFIFWRLFCLLMTAWKTELSIRRDLTSTIFTEYFTYVCNFWTHVVGWGDWLGIIFFCFINLGSTFSYLLCSFTVSLCLFIILILLSSWVLSKFLCFFFFLLLDFFTVRIWFRICVHFSFNNPVNVSLVIFLLILLIWRYVIDGFFRRLFLIILVISRTSLVLVVGYRFFQFSINNGYWIDRCLWTWRFWSWCIIT